jgi:two-component system, LytTR family, sensor kinase
MGSRRHLREAALALGGGTVLGLLLFLYRHLENVADRGHEPFIRPLVQEVTAAWIGVCLFFPVRAIARRYPLHGAGWPRRIPVHVVAVLAFGATYTSLIWLVRSLLFPLLGQGPYDYGAMPVRYFMELPVQVIVYALFVAGVHTADHHRRTQARDLTTAQLQAQLARTQLENLHLRLQPHFLFNALNTISSTMYEDPAAADEMIGRLGELLRASLRTRETQEVALRDELETLEAYLSLMRARFGPQVEVRVDADADTLDLAVPALLVQPLVENAFRHGCAAAAGRGRIEVRARRDAGTLRIDVRNDVPVDARSAPGSGLGLPLTSERLRLLYGDAHGFRAGPDGSGWYEVAIRLPARASEPLEPTEPSKPRTASGAEFTSAQRAGGLGGATQHPPDKV